MNVRKVAMLALSLLSVSACSAHAVTEQPFAVWLYPDSKAEIVTAQGCILHENLSGALGMVPLASKDFEQPQTRENQFDNAVWKSAPCGS